MKKKIIINKETLHQVSNDILDGVRGGKPVQTVGPQCAPPPGDPDTFGDGYG